MRDRIDRYARRLEGLSISELSQGAENSSQLKGGTPRRSLRTWQRSREGRDILNSAIRVFSTTA